jgi:hypothetical protein
MIAGDMDPNGLLRLVVSHPCRLQDCQWYHNDIFLVLSEELAMRATITTGRVVQVRGPAIFYIIQGPERSDRFRRRLQSHLKECHLMVFFCHTPAHWVLAVADTVSHTIQVFDPLPGRFAGRSVGRTLSSFIDSLVIIRASQDPVWSWSLGDCAEQTDHTSCGPRAILNIIRVVHHHANGVWSPGPDIRAMRCLWWPRCYSLQWRGLHGSPLPLSNMDIRLVSSLPTPLTQGWARALLYVRPFPATLPQAPGGTWWGRGRSCFAGYVKLSLLHDGPTRP